jgi:hypothetical protein
MLTIQDRTLLAVNVNRPAEVRQFKFVVTRAEDEQLAKMGENFAKEVLSRVQLNKGSLPITRFSLGHLEPGRHPR